MGFFNEGSSFVSHLLDLHCIGAQFALLAQELLGLVDVVAALGGGRDGLVLLVVERRQPHDQLALLIAVDFSFGQETTGLTLELK